MESGRGPAFEAAVAGCDHDLEEVRALLGHARIDTTQIYANIRPAQLKQAVAFYEKKAMEMLSE